jgi:hypothetical protein
LAYDPATYCWSVWLLHGTVLKNIGDGSFEIVLGGRWALLSNLEVAIVDAAVIDGAKRFRARMLGDKDCRLGRYPGVSKSNELVTRVEEDICFHAVVGLMPTHCFDSLSDVGIDEPKHYVLRGKFVFDTPQLRKVAIGDGTVGCDKEEDNRHSTGRGKTGNRVTIYVVAVRWWDLLRMSEGCGGQHTSQSP